MKIRNDDGLLDIAVDQQREIEALRSLVGELVEEVCRLEYFGPNEETTALIAKAEAAIKDGGEV